MNQEITMDKWTEKGTASTYTIEEFGELYQCRSVLVEITPQQAQAILKENRNNRPLYPANIDKISRALTNGHWKYLADPIRFDNNGNLIDGQHRLTAVMNTGIPIIVTVITGFPSWYFEYIDLTKPRSAKDALSLLGVQNAHTVSRILTFLWQLQRDDPMVSKQAPTAPEVVALFHQFGDVTNNPLYPHAYTANLAVPLQFPKAAVGVMSIIYEREDPELNAQFWKGVLQGIGIPETKRGDDARAGLRKYIDRHLIKVQDAKVVFDTELSAIWIHFAWQKFIAGKPITKGVSDGGYQHLKTDDDTLTNIRNKIVAKAKNLFREPDDDDYEDIPELDSYHSWLNRLKRK